jgi:mono/diheme cytochrome c family protein
MHHPVLAPLTALALLAACTSHEPAGPMSAPASFAEQVAAGQTLYAQHCAKCHGENGEGDEAPRVVGFAQGALPLDPPPDREVRRTRFVTVADVAEFTVANMPPKKAGSLSTEQYLAVLAFALKANGIDLGREPLTMAKARELVIPR